MARAIGAMRDAGSAADIKEAFPAPYQAARTSRLLLLHLRECPANSRPISFNRAGSMPQDNPVWYAGSVARRIDPPPGKTMPEAVTDL
jgi:hypothetical protein